MGRLVIDRGKARVSNEALELLRAELQEQLGDEHQIEIDSWRGVRELREGQEFIPVVELFLTGIAATSGVVSAVAAAARTWRRREKAPPRKVTRTQLWHFDKDGHPRLGWIEETEEGED